MRNQFLEAMYTMLFIELYVHDKYEAGDAESCMKNAYQAADRATEYWYAKNKESDNDNE